MSYHMHLHQALNVRFFRFKASDGVETTLLCTVPNLSWFSCVRTENVIDSAFWSFYLSSAALPADFGLIYKEKVHMRRKTFNSVTLRGDFKSRNESLDCSPSFHIFGGITCPRWFLFSIKNPHFPKPKVTPDLLKASIHCDPAIHICLPARTYKIISSKYAKATVVVSVIIPHPFFLEICKEHCATKMTF